MRCRSSARATVVTLERLARGSIRAGAAVDKIGLPYHKVFGVHRYWCVLACVSAAEAAFVQRFPGYHHVKLLLLLWLQSRRYQGAARLFRLLLRPALHQLRPGTEAFLARAAALAVRCACTRGMHLNRRHSVRARVVRLPLPQNEMASCGPAPRTPCAGYSARFGQFVQFQQSEWK